MILFLFGREEEKKGKKKKKKKRGEKVEDLIWVGRWVDSTMATVLLLCLFLLLNVICALCSLVY